MFLVAELLAGSLLVLILSTAAKPPDCGVSETPPGSCFTVDLVHPLVSDPPIYLWRARATFGDVLDPDHPYHSPVSPSQDFPRIVEN